MKQVTAIIKPFRLEAVRKAIDELGLEGMTVSEVKGYGRQRGQTEVYRGAEYTVTFVPKVKIEIVVDDSWTDRLIEAIQANAATGRIGDGKIFVFDVERAVRIRTGESGGDAL